jgi:porin
VRIVILLLLFLASPGVSSETNSDPTETEDGFLEGRRNTSVIGQGTTDLTNQLTLDAAPTDPLFLGRMGEALKSWYDWKDNLLERHGFQFTLAYSFLTQHATKTRKGNEDHATGGVFDLGGVWAAFKRDSDWQGMLGFRIADQHRLGTPIAPAGLGDEIGSAWGTSLAFGDVELNVIEGWWEQRLGSRAAIRLGKMDTSGLFDPSALGNPFEGFMGHPFTLNSTIPFPAEGLGAIGQVNLTKNLTLAAAVADANGNGSDWGFDSFFDQREYLKLAELAWFPDRSFGKGEYHLTVWNSDERVEANTPAGNGFTLHGEQRIGNLLPFIRYGHSSGGATALRDMIAMGTGFYNPFDRFSDSIGIGLSWGEPYEKNARDQFGVEAYYRVQLTNEIAITPDIQYIINPTQNTEVDSLWVFSLRVRANF